VRTESFPVVLPTDDRKPALAGETVRAFVPAALRVVPGFEETVHAVHEVCNHVGAPTCAQRES